MNCSKAKILLLVRCISTIGRLVKILLPFHFFTMQIFEAHHVNCSLMVFFVLFCFLLGNKLLFSFLYFHLIKPKFLKWVTKFVLLTTIRNISEFSRAHGTIRGALIQSFHFSSIKPPHLTTSQLLNQHPLFNTPLPYIYIYFFFNFTSTLILTTSKFI